jgi:hypothetical protein
MTLQIDPCLCRAAHAAQFRPAHLIQPCQNTGRISARRIAFRSERRVSRTFHVNAYGARLTVPSTRHSLCKCSLLVTDGDGGMQPSEQVLVTRAMLFALVAPDLDHLRSLKFAVTLHSGRPAGPTVTASSFKLPTGSTTLRAGGFFVNEVQFPGLLPALQTGGPMQVTLAVDWSAGSCSQFVLVRPGP